MNRTEFKFNENKPRILYQIKFILLITFQIPSIIISLLIFVFFWTHRTYLRSLHCQSLLFLLSVNFLLLTINLPMPIHFYKFGYVSPATASFCTWWTFIEYSLNLTSELLMVVISIQRHILVFHGHTCNNCRKRFLFYYIPLSLCLIYPIILYLIVIVFYPCDGQQWNYQSNLCGYANCYLVYNKILAGFDWGVNNGLPIVIILLCNITIVLCVKKRRHLRQSNLSRRQQRRMILQLFYVSCLYLIAWLPSLIIGLGQQTISSDFLADFQTDYALDLIYMICLFLSWICLGLLPECTKWLKKKLTFQRRSFNIIRPT